MRAFWKGSIQFGLINVPVSLHVASEDEEVSFKLLHNKDLSEIRYARICKDEDKEIPYNEIVKGIEQKGRYVVLTEDDFKSVAQERSKAIEISVFVDASEIESVYYEHPYYLVPEKGGEKAYALLHEALKKSGKVALGRYAFRNHIHVGAIKPYQHLLVLNQMRFHTQIRKAASLGDAKKVKISKQEVDMAEKLIEQLTGHFNPDDYEDTYVHDLKEMLRKKKAKAPKVPKTKKEVKKKTEPEKAKVYDLMALLKQSLKEKENTKKARKRG